ncbi:bifunctional methylenetetrahydrofolate dehydrogenase/methenyltetrahydrofolate cyclohydrolase FolD [Rhodohalobacter sp. SW132]|uniref:bifunctional methylenetetrahydrofolate dehydrogenase/methenyltetrahydrofolate cyclohydrolase FolD n=1 Tax=Rhodohalobacter sp. SW132 TaxID=2293433 RepID=UPI000E224B9B|nr:bifunctional methylenetetrahydrofolate dehydrogenase/methenyltetrahydrofolate cyclohydrolase FolD [Rhodohalobacter sp. SW132]REL38275.1 bifunctional methylenetetrahydrofolate dehydrogenase/methenyltetrahydrofolate cyclohydrolase FolD [Rhodohalobacter sp. SW132]
MSAQLIDGKKVAELTRSQIREDVESWVKQGNRPPFLQVIQIGSDPASSTYIGAKTRACNDVGIETGTAHLSDTISAKELKQEIRKFNESSSVDGILVQLPLPSHLSSHDVIESIDHRKDVDGFHPMNVGRLAVDQPTFRSCTPAGIFELFKHYSIQVKSKHAVVVGASNIVGSPMAIMLSRENSSGKATTTICHKYTKDITRHTIDADILIVAAGQPGLIKAEMVKEGVVIIDVGINRVADETSKKGYKLVGDCDFEGLREKASWITPVPGGVGPMTVAMLMKNTLLAAKKSIYPDA